MRGFVLVLLTVLADYVVLQGTARLQPVAAPYNGALDKNGSSEPPTLPPHLRDNRIYHITSAPVRLKVPEATSAGSPVNHAANRRLVDGTDLSTTTTTFGVTQPTTTTSWQQQPTTTTTETTTQPVTGPTELSKLVSQPQPTSMEPQSTTTTTTTTTQRPSSTTTTTTQRPSSTTTTTQRPKTTTTQRPKTTTTQRPQPTTTSRRPTPSTTTTQRPSTTKRMPTTTTTIAAATAMRIEAPKAPQSQHSIETRSGPDNNKLQKCPRSEDIHPCECVEVATPSEVLGEEGSRAEYEVETVAFCKNIRNVDVLREGLRGMQGHHMTYLVLDSVHLPPFPNDLFKNVGVGWMEVLNSTMQFQKQFFQCYEKGCA